MDGTAFPAWMDVGSFGGLTCAMMAAACLAVWALVYRRGTTRQSVLAILICLACAALMIFPVWWDQSRFEFLGNSLDGIEVTMVLVWIAFFGWALPLGMLASYVLLAETETPSPVVASQRKRSPHLEATLRLALVDPARYASVRRDDAPWAQLVAVNGESAAGERPLMLRKRLTLLGREIDNDVVLNDERISRHHAEIRVDHGVAVLLDYGSMNGTMIDKQLMTGPVPLKPDDIIELGTRRYRFLPLDGPAAAYEVDTSKIPGASGVNRRQTLPPAGPPALVVMTGEAVGSRWELLQTVISIGRDETCQLRLPDTTVSRRHAQVVRQPDGYYASDLESINGTKVNDDDLITPRRLRDGDVLHLGTVALRFEAMATSPDTLDEASTQVDEEPTPEERVASGQTTVPLTRDVVLSSPDGDKGANERQLLEP